MESFLFVQHNFALNQPNWSSVNYLVSVARLLLELELTYIYSFSLVALVTKYLSIITTFNSVVKMIYPKIWPI